MTEPEIGTFMRMKGEMFVSEQAALDRKEEIEQEADRRDAESEVPSDKRPF